LHFAPWIHTIFIVTDEQNPPLKELYQSHKIILVDHKEIIPSSLLPTFFSDVIESYLHNIPTLSEIFIYNNDDVFFFDTIYPCDIVDNDSASTDCVFRKQKLKIINHFCIDRTREYTSEYSKRIMNTTKLLDLEKNSFYINNHCSKVLRKSTLKYMEEMYKDSLDELRRYKFRNDKTIQYFFLALNVDHRLHENKIINCKNKCRNLVYKNFNEDYNDSMKHHFEYKKCKFACYNGMNHTFRPVFTNLIKNVFMKVIFCDGTKRRNPRCPKETRRLRKNTRKRYRVP
jgi:hypothetical protein